jgi:uncharacterized Zn-binding protein involved in type VI secretion
MRKLIFAGLMLGLLVPVKSAAQSPIDGTWKLDLSKAQMPKKPDVYLLQNGNYECKTCVPAISVKADGQDQKVTGHPYFDSIAVAVVDDHTIAETDKKDGKEVATAKMTVAADGKTATLEFTDSSNSNAAPVTGKANLMHLAPGPSGAHAISGSWRTSSMDNVSDNGLTFTYKVDGDSISMTSPTGQSYTAKLDGSDAAYKGDPGTDGVSVKKFGKDTFEEADKRGGKVISVAKMTVAPGGKTMTIAVVDKLHGTTMSFTADKQ